MPDAEDLCDDAPDGRADEPAGLDDTALTQLALDAVSHDPFEPDLDPFEPDEGTPTALLPEWYMPPPGGPVGRGRSVVMVGVAISLLVINIGGFCVTWGWPEFVWKG